MQKLNWTMLAVRKDKQKIRTKSFPNDLYSELVWNWKFCHYLAAPGLNAYFIGFLKNQVQDIYEGHKFALVLISKIPLYPVCVYLLRTNQLI